MLSVLLEAGGCSSKAIGKPGPDSIYVDQVKATILQLEGIDLSIDEILESPSAPLVSSVDWFLPSSRDKLESLAPLPLLSKWQNTSHSVISPASKKMLFGDSTLRTHKTSLLRGNAGSNNDGDNPEGERRNVNLYQSKSPGGFDKSSSLFKITKKKNILPGQFNLGSLKKNLSVKETELYNAMKLTSGPENTLFHYISLETMHGIFITPTHTEVAQFGGTLHPQLIKNFHRCCLSIRSLFQKTMMRETKKTAGTRRNSESKKTNSGLYQVREHGVLFECSPEKWTDQKKPPPPVMYWVIGRLFLDPKPREFYVCFHDSVTEVAVELAFKLSFGLAL
ncbi:UNVERIFIED_CONTAM: hypothetical protein K2H54_040124 [Gekko kuhli]